MMVLSHQFFVCRRPSRPSTKSICTKLALVLGGQEESSQRFTMMKFIVFSSAMLGEPASLDACKKTKNSRAFNPVVESVAAMATHRQHHL
ncbi:hypothetical protein [Pseudomonas syringae]|uniref:hypothetical protein n=1 Tax=Pseudomonas syringae TaxID=317 RepID=UPI001268F9BC|nr:hypothetical protein [Pseudomonas syringae]